MIATPVIGRRWLPILCVVAFLGCAMADAGAPPSLAQADFLPVGPFSTATADGPFPEGWTPFTFEKIRRHSGYSLVTDGGTVVVKASSDNAASGMIRKIRIDPRRYPVIHWRWKVDNVFRKGDVTRKAGDDYPARIYVTFHYDPTRTGLLDRAGFEAARLIYGEYPPMRAINYIWASTAPAAGVFPNPYTDKVKMIVVRTGPEQAGRWLVESRNLLNDYRRVFGSDPPDVSGVAIMTDSDNTGESATAWYGDIVFREK